MSNVLYSVKQSSAAIVYMHEHWSDWTELKQQSCVGRVGGIDWWMWTGSASD